MKRTIVSLVAVTALSLAGCSGSQDAPASSDASGQSASSESSGEPSVSDDEGGFDDLPDVLDASTLVEGTEGTSYRMTIEMASSEGETMRMTTEVVANPTSSVGQDTHLVMEMAGNKTEIMIIGEDYYQKAPSPIDGKTWIKGPIPPDTADLGLGLDTVTETFTEGLESNSLTKVGEEGGLVKYQAEGGYVWIDGERRLARVEAKQDGNEAVMTFSDWDGDFTITPPPASEVMEQP